MFGENCLWVVWEVKRTGRHEAVVSLKLEGKRALRMEWMVTEIKSYI